MSLLPATWPRIASASDQPLRFDALSLYTRCEAGECWIESAWLTPNGESRQPQSQRFLTGASSEPVLALPRLPDRPVVSRPQVTTVLLPRERATLLVGTVLWVKLTLGDRTLLELPTVRLSDTWFGPNSREGELCYASQTRARLRLLDIESAWRALTPVTIINRGDDVLKLDRLNVPVPNLSLYSDGKQFWTSGLTVGRDGDNAPAKVQIDSGPPALSPRAALVAPPRRAARTGVFDRAINLIFA